MGINWKIVLGKMGETLATREDEYRKFATDYFTKKFETRAEEKRAFDEKIREQKREINKKIDALRAEGLTDTQIANGLNTYKENFFAVVADDLSDYKKSDNYKYLISQDPTGGKFRDFYKERFDNLIATESQQGLQLDPVVQGLLDKFPEPTETPEIAQSIFGFDYTKGIRDDIKGLSKDTNVPDYDAPAGLTGLSSLLSGTIRDVPQQQTYTGTMLDKQIVKRLQVKYGDFKLNVDSTRFETTGEKDQKKLDKIKAANAEAVRIQQKFNEERSKTPPGSMEGGMSDAELLDKVVQDLGVVSTTSDKAEGDKAEGDKKDEDTTATTSSISKFMTDNPESAITKAFEEGDAVNISRADMLSIIKRASGEEKIEDILNEYDLTQSQRIRIMRNIATAIVDTPDKISEILGSTAVEEIMPKGNMARPDPSKIGDSRKFKAKKNLENKKAKAWDETYGAYLNSDGTLKEGITQDQLDSALPLIKRKYEEALEN
tara:strand:- start:13577 stop:15043 length:1467 start_codon:yes stop_codon:yes gene_type:complete